MYKILPRILVSALLISLMVACAGPGTSNDETKGWSADKLYSEAKSAQASREYDKSNKYFERLEARYPYGKFAQQAQLEIAYNYYKDQEQALALAAIDRFMKQNPAHPSLDYALYLKGLVTFTEIQGFLAAISQQDLSERDPKAARESFNTFRELTTRFPDSKYYRDAQLRMGYLIGALANYELHVGRYYYKRGAYLAAANRGKALIDNFSNTKQVEGALALMYHSYDKLGMTAYRDDTKRILMQNFPNSQALEKDMTVDIYWWAPI
ncbi:outer membrane protein assembly factor BamD [Chitinibacter bivalviorum]|uniref:Outer membrane protein assembly factor BamD n=1 Tax=Chitinibacter bivalviorum TaxID=2739434 RepID=A0A7H9BGZ6_9NEIS|nr:outer membrane protein assembly factor BamD [Chitinibacter bivalviorum]QLG86804.1 outer membrane protein assembly factor BamD [Chitinibacter bivalviorum]